MVCGLVCLFLCMYLPWLRFCCGWFGCGNSVPLVLATVGVWGCVFGGLVCGLWFGDLVFWFCFVIVLDLGGLCLVWLAA